MDKLTQMEELVGSYFIDANSHEDALYSLMNDLNHILMSKHSSEGFVLKDEIIELRNDIDQLIHT